MAAAHTRSSSRIFSRRTKCDWSATRVHRTPSWRERTSQKKHAHSEKRRSTPTAPREKRRRGRTALVRDLYTPRMQISGSNCPVDGATLAHWSGEKEACISPDPDIRTRGTVIFPKTKSLGWRFRRSSGRGAAAGGRRGGVEAMVGGWRKMAAV